MTVTSLTARMLAKAAASEKQLFILNPAVQKPRITRITRMITASAKGGSLLLAHPPGESSLQRNIFFIRVIREIRGPNCFFQVY
jgi:hypothetical protein